MATSTTFELNAGSLLQMETATPGPCRRIPAHRSATDRGVRRECPRQPERRGGPVRERGRIAVWDVRRGSRVARLEGTPQVYSNDPAKQWTAIIPDGARLAALGQDRRGVVPPAPVERIGLTQTFPTLPFAVGLIAHVLPRWSNWWNGDGDRHEPSPDRGLSGPGRSGLRRRTRGGPPSWSTGKW
jgi:hypothetical protein